MKRLSTGVLAVIFAAGLGLNAIAAPSSKNAPQGNIGTYADASTKVAQASAGTPPADFGSPPSGEIPILFNDRHVYTKPDRLNQGRVLAALVRGNTILIPLRSMFEQMGATVSYDPASKTVDVSKPGSDVKVTVGRAEVVINGESRPLDVPPEIYKGTVVVPVRVISEGMGAYVQWVPDKRLVVVRYVPPAPPPPPPPTTAPATPRPTAPPTPPPTPTPAPKATIGYEHFIAGDYIFSPKVYNELSPGNTGNNSYQFHGAFEFPAFGLPWMLEGDYRQFQYPHNSFFVTPPVGACPSNDPGCVTTVGGQGFPQAYLPAFTAREQDFDGRFGLKIADPRIYIGVGYIYKQNNYNYPNLRGFGFGASKLPDLEQPFSIYGSAWYYPNVKGNYGAFSYAPGIPQSTAFTTCANSNGTAPVCQYVDFGGTLAYRIFKYQIGGTFTLGSSPFFLDFGVSGDQGRNKQNAPSDYNHAGAYLGLGLRF